MDRLRGRVNRTQSHWDSWDSQRQERSGFHNRAIDRYGFERKSFFPLGSWQREHPLNTLPILSYAQPETLCSFHRLVRHTDCRAACIHREYEIGTLLFIPSSPALSRETSVMPESRSSSSLRGSAWPLIPLPKFKRLSCVGGKRQFHLSPRSR